MARPFLILTLAVLLGGTARAQLAADPAQAQLAVAPQEVSVTVEQHETTTRTLALTNTGSEALSFCLSFDRPLQRIAGEARISDETLVGASGAACGEYGEVLALIGRADVPTEVSWDPYGLTMTPDGRLFAADNSRGTFSRTVELTPELDYVRQFPFPREYELDFSPTTSGLTYNADTATLWWLNVEASGVVYRALLLEGDLDGVPTGRRIELPIGEDLPPDERVSPYGLAYDAVTDRYHYANGRDDQSETIWAVDTLGNAAPGYPVAPEAYPDADVGFALDAHSTGGSGDAGDEGAAGLRFEFYLTSPPGVPPPFLGVAGRYGEDPAPGAEPLETPLPESLAGTVNSGMAGEPVRSRLDPNGVLYYPWSGITETDTDAGIVAIRPHPLPPSWLVVEAWDGTLGPGESTEIELTFRPGGRALGEYTAVLQAFEAEMGTAVEVPLSMTVTQGTDAEDEPATPEGSSLTVHPNPTAGRATVTLALSVAAKVRAAVYDVLGREVAVLHDGPLAAGSHRLAFDGDLPTGVYLVRATGDGFDAAQRVTVVR